MGLEKSYPRVIITTMNFQGNVSDMWYTAYCVCLTMSLESRYDYFNFKN